MEKIKFVLNKIKKFIFKYGDVVNYPITLVTGVVATKFFEPIFQGKEIDNFLFIVLVVLVVIEMLIIFFPKASINNDNERIIKETLKICSNSLFSTLNSNEWSVCGMIQVPKNDKRRTPYFINPNSNPAIRNHRNKDFGDIGKAFFSGKVTSPYFVKSLSKDSWESSEEEYKKDVPKNLRAILAAAIFSTEENDSEKVIGVLEFDIFSCSSNIVDSMPSYLFKQISTQNNMNIMCNCASIIAVLMDNM